MMIPLLMVLRVFWLSFLPSLPFFSSPQVLFIYFLAVAVFSRSHCSKSLVTGANIYSNFLITPLPNRGSTQWKCITCVSQRPAALHSFPGGPKLICCGQIVCEGENVSCCLVASILQPPPFVSAPADSCSLTAGTGKDH